MFKTKFYLVLASLMLTTSAQAYETITVGNLEVQLLTSGERAYNVIGQVKDGNIDGLYAREIIGESTWSQEQKDAIRRSLEVINQSFNTGTPSRNFEIAMALNPLPPRVLGNSLGTLLIDENFQNITSTGELLLRDNSDVERVYGGVDDTILLSSDFPLDSSPGNTSSYSYDLQTIVTHEILHALGITAMKNSDGDFDHGSTTWSSLLKDIYGNSITHVSPTGVNGTVFWTGEYANATYGGPVPIQTFADKYQGGSSLVHPGTQSELMSWRMLPGTGPRSMNKLLLDMYRDMGWDINEDYYDSLGSTFYSNGGTISNTTDFTADHSYTYGMYVNGLGNVVEQNSYLRATAEQSQAVTLTGDLNILSLNGQQIVESNYSQAVKVYGIGDLVQTHQDNKVTAQGIESTGIFILGSGNALINSGSISASNGAVAIRVDNLMARHGYPISTNVHIQSGSQITGDIVNGDSTSSAGITFGRNYADDLSYIADHDFDFTFNDDFVGRWNYDFHAGTVRLANTLTLQELSSIKGNGTVAGSIESSGLIAPGNSVGTLTITGDLTQNPTSSLEIEFGEKGHDQLNVDGTVYLNGSLSLIPIGYHASGSLQFINAGAINGNFVTINNFTSAVLETSTLTPESFTLTRNSYSSLVNNSFAEGLDDARPTATGDMANILNQIDLMNLADLTQATDDLSPHIYNSVTTATLDAIKTRSTFLQNKVKSEGQNNNSPLWFSGYGGKTHYDQMTASEEFTVKSKGFMLGVNKEYGTGFSLGAATAFTDFDLTENDSSSSSSGSLYDCYLYGSWIPQANDSFYVQTILGLGFSDFDTDREIAFLSRTANSDQDATHYSAFMGSGYNHKVGAWSIEPRVGLEYIYLDEDSFNETGADGASLKIDSKESDAVISSVGMNMSHNFMLESSTIIPNIRADWFHNFSTSTDETTGNLQSGESFGVNGRDASEDALELGLGLKIVASDQLHGYIDYQYTFADEQDRSHLISAGFNYNF